jgi:hypothetical protein
MFYKFGEVKTGRAYPGTPAKEVLYAFLNSILLKNATQMQTHSHIT